jgi:hypothetical protein
LDDESLRTLAANIDDMAPNILAIWSAIYPILMGLEVGKGAQFGMTLNGSLLKLNAMLTFETCSSLDNYQRTRTEGKIRINYKFSALL